MDSQGLQKKLTRTPAIDINESDPLINFIVSTMQKSQKDRNVVLRVETDLREFVKDQGRPSLPFPAMSSYHRMLVHRISSLFNLNHNIDPIGSCVVVSKNGREKLPEFSFRDLEKPPIKKSKSLEQRELEYNKARQRIFQQDKSESFGGFRNERAAVASISPASSGYKSLVMLNSSEEDFSQMQFSQEVNQQQISQQFNQHQISQQFNQQQINQQFNQQQISQQINQQQFNQFNQYPPQLNMPMNQMHYQHNQMDYYPPQIQQYHNPPPAPPQQYPQIIYVPIYIPQQIPPQYYHQNNFINRKNRRY